ncbi:MAG: hypothetical protein J6J16_08730 [Lachnospiraceae bacterium]|nr:hypothetical protein [Lachnospiraceae bacterium]
MNWNEAHYESSQLIVVTERLNKCRESKLLLELELSNEEFNNKYISKRKTLTKEKARTRMVYVGIASLVMIVCLVVFIGCYRSIVLDEYSWAAAVGMLTCMLVMLFGIYPCVRLWIPEIRMMKKLNTKNKNNEKGVISFDTEAEKSNEKISIMKNQLEELNKEIENLERKQKEEEVLLKVRILAEQEKKTQADANAKFKINKDKAGELQYVEIVDLYDSEIRRCKEDLNRLEVEKDMLRREKKEVNEEFELTKKKAFMYLIMLVVLSFIHECFEGKAYAAVGVVIGVSLVAGFIYIVSSSEKPIVRYLLENNNKIIQDYAFVKGLEPISKRERRNLLEISSCKEWLKDCEEKKKAIQKELDDLNEWRN